jgi:hypothetical protein
MSRSYKKFPCWSAPHSNNGIHSGVHYAKQLANQKARKPWYWDTPSGGAYKKITDPWDIRDYKSVYYTKQAVQDAIDDAIRDINNTEYDHQYRYRTVAGQVRRNRYALRYWYYSK